MKKSILVTFSFFLLIFIVGCQQESAIDWKYSKEAAVESGLKYEGVDRGSVLSIDAYEGETFVIYVSKGGLGIANIVESEQGFGWKRSQPYYDFETAGELGYSTSGFDIEMETGASFSVLVGEAFDPSIEQMKLTGDGTEMMLKVFDDSQFFYALHTIPADEIAVSPIAK